MSKLSPNEIAERLFAMLKTELHDNSYYNDERMVSTKTPDYLKIQTTVPTLIQSSNDLTGSHQGITTRDLLKLCIRGAFGDQLSDPGSSQKNYEMIGKLYDATKEDAELWEAHKDRPTNTPAGWEGWVQCISASAGAAIVADRMIMETFSIPFPPNRENGTETLKAAIAVAKKFSKSPAFNKEFEGSRRFNALEANIIDYKKHYPPAEIDQEVALLAKDLVGQKIEKFAVHRNGRLSLDAESAAKFYLFTGKIISPTLEAAMEKAKAPKKADPEMEPA